MSTRGKVLRKDPETGPWKRTRQVPRQGLRQDPFWHPVPIWYFYPAVGTSHLAPCSRPHGAELYSQPSAEAAGGPPATLFPLGLTVGHSTGISSCASAVNSAGLSAGHTTMPACRGIWHGKSAAGISTGSCRGPCRGSFPRDVPRAFPRDLPRVVAAVLLPWSAVVNHGPDCDMLRTLS